MVSTQPAIAQDTDTDLKAVILGLLFGLPPQLIALLLKDEEPA
jgi:hypothetical protein